MSQQKSNTGRMSGRTYDHIMRVIYYAITSPEKEHCVLCKTKDLENMFKEEIKRYEKNFDITINNIKFIKG